MRTRVRHLQCCDINLPLRTNADLGLRKVAWRQQVLVQPLRDERCPRVMEPFPVSCSVQRRMKVIEQWHQFAPGVYRFILSNTAWEAIPDSRRFQFHEVP